MAICYPADLGFSEDLWEPAGGLHPLGKRGVVPSGRKGPGGSGELQDASFVPGQILALTVTRELFRPFPATVMEYFHW